ncbi:MAG TPA: ribosome small subunit-dependent GTPase A [Cytophagales bacterium]|nr:ribosome small subunit-dependent GTPase A [Cytophagales bacterium]HAP62689.1 ribosome small subunit-dependent GTPase A [Cytophagales bacterium]
MDIKQLGFNKQLETYRSQHQLDRFNVGRVVKEHKDRFLVLAPEGEIESELLGNLRYTAQSRADLPAVGDWVAITLYDGNKGIIHQVYPRHSQLERQAVGRSGEKQLIATNVDYGIIVQSLNRDFNANRIERYLTLCHQANITPMVVLSKIDLLGRAEADGMIQAVKDRLPQVTVLPLSNASGEGMELLRQEIQPGKTYCLLGSSGVGKSTLINQLSGSQRMDTGAISERIDRGKHVTTHRELIVLETGAIFIDNPGLREVGIADSQEGLEKTFEQIYDLIDECKFNDCTHTTEKGCAVLAALEAGDLDEDVYQNYMRLEREQAHYAATVHERREREKSMGKLYKSIIQQKQQNR